MKFKKSLKIKVSLLLITVLCIGLISVIAKHKQDYISVWSNNNGVATVIIDAGHAELPNTTD